METELIYLFVDDGGIIETTPEIAAKYDLKEFDYISDTATLLNLVLETDRFLAKIKS